MNEIVKRLREAPNYNAGVGTSTIENEAADLIESLQARLIKSQSDLWRKTGECDGLREGADLLKEQLVTAQKHIDTLKSQLAASQRRERAAVADLKCAYMIGDDNYGDPIYDCGLCSICAKSTDELCDCASAIGEGFEWRGPQEAEKGEAE